MPDSLLLKINNGQVLSLPSSDDTKAKREQENESATDHRVTKLNSGNEGS